MRLLKQSSTAQPLVFLMVLSSDHISGATGLSPTVTLSKNGGSFTAPSGSVTEIANGWYQVAGNASDTGTLGPLVLHAIATGADPSDTIHEVVAFDPQVAPPTAAQIATALWQDLLSSSDFNTAGSVGALVKTNLDTNVGSRMATFTTVTLAASQPNYAPAKVGDKMDLVDAPNAAAVTAIQNGLATAAGQTDELNLLAADRVVDITTDPTQYHEVFYASGTSTVLLTKKLYDVAGAKLNSTSTVVGQVRQ